MAEELTNLNEGLCLTEVKKQEVLIPQEEVLLSEEKSKRCLAVLVITEKEVNKGAFRATMSKAWQVIGRVTFKDLGQNKFLVEFQSALEKTRVLKSRPWTFDRFLVNIQDCESCLTPKDLSFSKENFWIQLHDLPFAGMNKTIGEKLGATMGEVLVVDVDAGGLAWGKYLRVKV
ncbi:uncharacterized protein LOC122289287 [Carya illinoinensis]|uniref:uncharacterized protein LOC122289287 n=1 Tax=Carya illinoinensis TaxID=32201 RepID=UPI001C727029|nr:uncharacterized protein LOC122289287 [Carya illinoinensis]